MANLNVCHFIGTLTRDVELRVTPKGTAVGQFSLAINRRWKDDQGGEKEEVSFLEFEAWGKTAEIIAKYTEKGRQLYVEARAKQDTWDDKETQKKRSKIKFVVDGFQFLSDGRKRDGGDGDRTQEQRPAPSRQAPPPGGRSDPKPADQENLDEDVPF